MERAKVPGSLDLINQSIWVVNDNPNEAQFLQGINHWYL